MQKYSLSWRFSAVTQCHHRQYPKQGYRPQSCASTYNPRKCLFATLLLGLIVACGLRVESVQAQSTHQPAEPHLTQSPAPDPDLARQLGAIEPVLPSLYLGVNLLPQLPALTGMHGARHYLLIVQNSDELRATGGFISALGVITLDKGRLANLEFVDSYRLYQSTQSYPPAPAPMQQFMNIPYLLFRDANWSPDFPTTATLLQAIYRQETGLDVDGIVTVDLHALELIVGALAPLPMPNTPEALTGANVVNIVKEMWAQPEAGETITEVGLGQWWGQRKNFIPTLAEAVMTKVRSGGVDYISLAMAAERALNERAMQIWFVDKAAAAQVAKLGWDGRLQVPEGTDYLSLIDTNMGYNKANAVIERTMAYTVTWAQDRSAAPEATLAISYQHPLNVTDHLCDLTPRYGKDYHDLVERCFFNYVRVYVPSGSKLLWAEGVQADSVRTTRGEHGTQIFAGYFVLPPGESIQVRFHYQLPPELMLDPYQLLVQRQAGSGPLPLVLTIGEERVKTTLRGNTLFWPPR